MEVEELIRALESTIRFLRNSRASAWANMSIEEMIQELESAVDRIANSQPMDAKLLALLFAPTGAIQETAIDNEWGDDFLKISEIVDRFTTDS